MVKSRQLELLDNEIMVTTWLNCGGRFHPTDQLMISGEITAQSFCGSESSVALKYLHKELLLKKARFRNFPSG